MKIVLWLLVVQTLWPTILVSAGDNADMVEVITKTEYQETNYCLTKDHCRLCWTTYQTALNREVIRNHSRCDQPLEAQLPYLERILAHILANDAARNSFNTFFWGRLTPDSSQGGIQMAFRLSLAASRSPFWDSKKGKPKQGHSTAFVRDLANNAAIYPELSSLFERYDFRLMVESVEKVLVSPAAQLPFFNKLKTQGVGRDEKLPFDCQVWFRIRSK